MESYKWLYNLTILALYYLCCSAQAKVTEYIDAELTATLKVQERVLLAKLDASIRFHLRKQGLTFIKNTYTGFDTEFNNISLDRNSLVSVQLAIA